MALARFSLPALPYVPGCPNGPPMARKYPLGTRTITAVNLTWLILTEAGCALLLRTTKTRKPIQPGLQTETEFCLPPALMGGRILIAFSRFWICRANNFLSFLVRKVCSGPAGLPMAF